MLSGSLGFLLSSFSVGTKLRGVEVFIGDGNDYGELKVVGNKLEVAWQTLTTNRSHIGVQPDSAQ